jgi:phospholipid transport system substrate-binding protein
MNMKKIVTIFTALLLMGFTGLAKAQPLTPSQIIQDDIQHVLQLAKKDDGKNAQAIRRQVCDYVLPKFDFTRMTALALGKNWRSATPQQQTELTAQFQALLTHVYSSTMIKYKTAQVTVNPNADMQANASSAIVHTSVTLPTSDDKKPISIDYYLHQGPQGWTIFNVSVEGASLVTAYRNDFDSVIKGQGVDGLIQTLKNKNAKLAAAS